MAVKVGTAYVDIEGDFSAFDRQVKHATSGTGDKFRNIGKAAAAGLAVGAAGFVALGKASADAAIESEKSAARMQTQLKALGISYKANAAEIERVIQKTSRLAGLDDEDLQDAFTNIVRTTGDVNKALNLVGLAADFARAKQIDVAKAGEIVAKVAGGNTGILSRYGITIEKGASATEALGLMQNKFAGQAEAYGKTTAGAQDRFRVAVENLQEKLGAYLLPAIASVASALTGLITSAENGTGVFGTLGSIGGTLADGWSRYKDVLIPVGAALGAVAVAMGTYAAAAKVAAAAQVALNIAMTANPIGVVVVGLAALAAAVVVAYKRSEEFRNVISDVGATLEDVGKVVQRVAVEAWELFGSVVSAQASNIASSMRSLFDAIRQVLKGITDLVAGVFTGDWSRAWDGVKSIVSGVWTAITALIQAALNTIKNVIQGAMTAIAAVMSGAWTVIKAAAAGAWNGIRDVILAPMRAVRATLDTGENILGGIGNRLSGAWEGFKTAASAAWTAIKNLILTPMRAARDLLDAGGENILGGIRNRLSGAWESIKGITDTAWDTVKGLILGPLRAARNALDAGENIMGGMLNRIERGFGEIIKGVGGWAGDIKDKIVDAFRGAADKVKGFIKAIIKVINLIPGVPNISTDGLAEGGSFSKEGVEYFAKGGITSGGFVNKPIVMMGEEAPRHPEWVIPTNPAYRKRAKMLLGRAASSIGVPITGFAVGGAWSQDQLSVARTALSVAASMNAGPKATLALIEAGIVESNMQNLAYGDRDSVGFLQQRPSQGWTGLMNVAAAAREFLERAIPLADQYGTAGELAQAVQRSAFPDRYNAMAPMAQQLLGSFGVTGGGGGIEGLINSVLDAVGGAVGGAVDALTGIMSQGASFILNKLPGVGGLPDWLKGTGKYVLEKVTAWIKDKVTGLLGVGSGGASGSVQKAIQLAASMGFAQPSLNQTSGGAHAPGSLHYAGRAVDFGDAGHSMNEMRALFNALLSSFGSSINELFYDPMPFHINNGQRIAGPFGGHHDHIHIAFAKGGMFGKKAITGPFVGSYATGGVVPRDGLAYVHQGETITPRGEEYVPIVLQLDGQVLDQRTVRLMRAAATSGRGAYYAGRHR